MAKRTSLFLATNPYVAHEGGVGPQVRRAVRDHRADIARGTGRAEALRRAKLRMLKHPRFAHPYYWAAFIAAGDWRPLDKGTMRPSEPN